MHTRTLNELRVSLELRPTDLLLVKEGRHLEGGDKDRRRFNRGPHVVRNPPRPRLRDSRDYGEYDSAENCFDMAFVSTETASGAGRFYLPGSSLRGVLRQAAEQVVARWRPDLLSDPFVTKAEDPRCGSDYWLRRCQERDPDLKLDGPTVYRHALPIERCFGHSALRGRWVAADAVMDDEVGQFQRKVARIEVRDGVGIDRFTGAARDKIKYQYEALSGGIFSTTITLTNYERWQPGLLAHALAAIDGGSARVGYGTRRGLGRVRLLVKELRWRWYGSNPGHDKFVAELPGLGDLASLAELKGDYGFQERGPAPAVALSVERDELYWQASLTPPADPRGPTATDWMAAPWPELARPLAQTLLDWERKEVSHDG